MKFIISGFQEYVANSDLKPSFLRRGYASVDYLVIPDKEEVQNRLGSGEHIDLLVFGGSPAKDFKSKNGSFEFEYTQYADLARRNPKIPSVLIVNNAFLGVIKNLSNAHPPSVTCFWDEFGNFRKEQIDAVIAGRNMSYK
jgi:hypothetical protein